MSALCLTLDVDWAHDAVIRDALALVQAHGARTTWFATHATPVLDEIAAEGHEIGLHPNFNGLLSGGGGSVEAVLAALRDIVPNARAVRSHSLVRSSRLAYAFVAAGITHESNSLVPPWVAPQLGPWRDFSGLVQTPIRWEDDVRLLDAAFADPAEWWGEVGLLTVDFHPIHLFLNSVEISDYEGARADFQDPERLLQRRRPTGSGGTRDRFLALMAKAAGNTVLMTELAPDWAAT